MLRLISIVRKLLFRLFNIETPFMRLERLIKDGRVVIGDYTYGWQSMVVDVYYGCEDVKVYVGKFSSIGPSLRIITSGIHPTNWVSTFPFRSRFDLPGKFEDGMPSTRGDIVIGNDVWIGTEVLILSGVTVGNGAVIASRSVVTKDVPPYSIVAGNKASVIRYRFSEEEIARLQEIKWWDWDINKIKKNVHLLSSPNIDDFLKINSI